MSRAGIRILIVDDHDVVHWGFRLLFSEQPWVERCVAARTRGEALALARRHAPHVALVDLFVGRESGAEICEELRALSPGTRVLLISGVGRISPQAATAAGASGFVAKDWSSQDVIGAVRMVARGMTVFETRPDDGSVSLSPREREILEQISNGATNREIAGLLCLSPHTVKEHTTSLYRKLEARNRAQAVQQAQRLGLLT